MYVLNVKGRVDICSEVLIETWNYCFLKLFHHNMLEIGSQKYQILILRLALLFYNYVFPLFCSNKYSRITLLPYNQPTFHSFTPFVPTFSINSLNGNENIHNDLITSSSCIHKKWLLFKIIHTEKLQNNISYVFLNRENCLKICWKI